MMKISKLSLAAAAFAASSMLIAGCGSSAKVAERAPAPGAWQSVGDPQNVITKENFDSLSTGLSLSDMEGLYGKATLLQQSIVDGVYSSTYRFQDGPKIVDVTFTHENCLNNPLSRPQITDMEFTEMPMVAQRVVK